MERALFVLTVVASLGSGLIAGAFFVFSVAVMRALGERPANEGMAAMQSINIVIINPIFLAVFLGTGLASAVLAVLGVLRWDMHGSGYSLAGAVLYVVGSLIVTIAINVRMNNALAAADPSSADGQELWKYYLTNWTRWNHLRAAASLAALFCFFMSLSSAR
jgi:uncharacterized membrane protein